MRLLVWHGRLQAVQALLATLCILTILSIAYFVLVLIEGCLSGDAHIFGPRLWASFHIGLLAAHGALWIAYLIESPVLLQITLAGSSSPYADLFHYYRMLVIMLVTSFFLSGGILIPSAFLPSFTEHRFKDYLFIFSLGWVPMSVPLLANLVQLCRLWSKLEEQPE